jgi:hypothetical protein
MYTPTALLIERKRALTAREIHFCVTKSFEQLKKFKNGPVPYLGQELTILVIKSQIHIVRQSL